jgi:hypothetical protein
MVLWVATSCGLVCRYEDCGVLGERERPCFLMCRCEDYGVQNVIPRGLICRFEGYHVPGCDTMFFGI